MTGLIAIGAGIAVLTGIGAGIGIGIATSKATECSFSVDWSINWCKWCRSFYPRSRNAAYSLDTLLYSLLKYESRPSNSDCLSSFVTSV